MAVQTHIIPDQGCPACGHSFTAATGGRKPCLGDIAVCIKCFNPLRFGDDLALYVLQDTDIAALPKQQRDGLRYAQQVMNERSRQRRSTSSVMGRSTAASKLR